jgi:hypothetical protein
MIDMLGEVRHRWMIDPSEIWPRTADGSTGRRAPEKLHQVHSQGMAVLRDGSVVVNLSNRASAKLDRCGEVVWTVNRPNHHSIQQTADGGFWIPSQRDVQEIDESILLPGLAPDLLRKRGRRYENLLLRIDAEGRVIQELSVLEPLVRGGFDHRLYDIAEIDRVDPTHVNDIEIVTQALADKLPGVERGDLLVSIRQMHMLAIFDAETGEIQWHHSGPWVRQHDPDITPEGNIVVFNNHFGPHSSLMEIDPATREVVTRYPKGGPGTFKSSVLGTHQALPNGNWLINESVAGRLFEVDESGEIVWEYIRAYDERHAALFEDAIRLAPDYFDEDVEAWDCAGDRSEASESALSS